MSMVSSSGVVQHWPVATTGGVWVLLAIAGVVVATAAGSYADRWNDL